MVLTLAASQFVLLDINRLHIAIKFISRKQECVYKE